MIIDLNDPENPLGGVCLTFDGEEWVKSEIDSNMIKLVWDDSEALLSWEGKNKWEHEFKQEDVNVIVYVPTTSKCSLTINGVEHVSIVSDIKITNNQTLACDNEVKINGGYRITSDSDANDKGIESKSSVTKDGKKILGYTMAIAIDDFTNLDNWYYEYYDEWYDTNVTEFDPSVYFSENVKNGTFRVDVLNLSFVAVGDFKGMTDAIEKLDEEDDEKTYCDKLCDLLNKRTDIVLFYNDTNEKIAEVVFQTAWYDYDEYGYYDIEPIILFPDGSKFAFEDYFTESAFGDLIEELENIANEFMLMVE